MTRQVPFVLLGFFVIGCSRNPSVPKNVLPPEKMQAVLWDAMLADQAAEFYSEGFDPQELEAIHGTIPAGISDS